MTCKESPYYKVILYKLLLVNQGVVIVESFIGYKNYEQYLMQYHKSDGNDCC